MRTTTSYIRFLIFIGISFWILTYCFSPDTPLDAIENGLFWLVLLVISVIGLAGEICVGALQAVLFNMLSKEKQFAFLKAEEYKKVHRFDKINALYIKLLGSKPLEEEREIILDHNYDGIQELDNNLPPWWVYGFYATILFAAIYLIRFEVFNDYNQAEEYEAEVTEAKILIEEWRKTAKNLVDVNTVTVLTDASDLKAGKAIFASTCVACHKADGGGGIGPNLTDQYWILGGGIKNIFNTISEGGRDGKGMISWKTELKPVQMAQVASYILSLQGTIPAEPKDPEGELWVDPNAPTSIPEVKEITRDSTDVKVAMGN